MFLDNHRYAFLNYVFILCLSHAVIALDNIQDSTEAAPKEMSDMRKLSWDVYCKLQPSSFRCTNTNVERKYFFDSRLHDCGRFDYGHCKHSYNSFDGRHDCMAICQDKAYDPAPKNITENVYCRFQPDFGDCNSYHPMFYFDINEFKCKGFSYSGCGGNSNRFPSAQDCAAVCGTVVKNE